MLLISVTQIRTCGSVKPLFTPDSHLIPPAHMRIRLQSDWTCYLLSRHITRLNFFPLDLYSHMIWSVPHVWIRARDVGQVGLRGFAGSEPALFSHTWLVPGWMRPSHHQSDSVKNFKIFIVLLLSNWIIYILLVLLFSHI